MHRGATSLVSWSAERRNGEKYSADIVVVSCGAINSAALLLRSANDKHPARPRQRLGCGRPPLHGAREFDIDGGRKVPQSGRSSRRLSSVNDFYLRLEDLASIPWGTSRSSESWTESLSARAPPRSPLGSRWI